MTRVQYVLTLMLLLLGSSSVFAEQCGWPERDALETIVPVTSDDGSHASGVVIERNMVLTAAHAVDEHYQSYICLLYTSPSPRDRG